MEAQLFHWVQTTRANALVARGQKLPVPRGMSRLYVLAASVSGDQNVAFRVGNVSTNVTIQDWSGFIGQWDDRQWRASTVQLKPRTPPPDIPPDIAALLAKIANAIVIRMARWRASRLVSSSARPSPGLHRIATRPMVRMRLTRIRTCLLTRSMCRRCEDADATKQRQRPHHGDHGIE